LKASLSPPSAPAPEPRPLPAAAPAAGAPTDLKEAVLAEVRAARKMLYEVCLSQARRIEAQGDRLVFTFAPAQRMQRQQVEQSRSWLESIASRIAGRKVTVAAVLESGADEMEAAAAAPAAPTPAEDRKARLKAEALSDAGVQAMLDVFGGEIQDVEEIK
jgi:hypothetical protein